MNYLYFSMLPLRTAEEVGGWGDEAAAARGLAVAVTWDQRHRFRHFTSHQQADLISVLDQSDCVVGYNCKAFDFRVLQFVPRQYCDLLVQIGYVADEIVSLHRAFRDIGTRPVLSRGSVMEKRWREGEESQVITALSRHVGAIRRLHEHILQDGWILYQSWKGPTKRVKISLR